MQAAPASAGRRGTPRATTRMVDATGATHDVVAAPDTQSDLTLTTREYNVRRDPTGPITGFGGEAGCLEHRCDIIMPHPMWGSRIIDGYIVDRGPASRPDRTFSSPTRRSTTTTST